ncbi:c-type cytochrome [Cytobacillus sp. FJAT-54145]|uniref:C-type cytochrome n=1 Tax=Cytobacillus spartinae TaxID=3299023 RepID=A0ABW6KGH0_9BACI
MKKPVISFIISALIGLGVGYLVFDVVAADDSNKTEVVADKESTSQPASDHNKEEATTVATEENLLQAKGCLGCHSVSGLNLSGGVTGPDLTQSFNNVEGKHGKPLDQFLKEPTSAVMSGVISGNPLTDEEITGLVKLLEEASQSH